MVIWLLGVSGAGKSTLGNRLKSYCDAQGIKSFLLDGDLVRDFYDNDLGYSPPDRRHNIKRIMLAARVLEQNGIIPIVCNISPFEDLRRFARQKFDNYQQVYLRKDIRHARTNDVKNIYKDHMNKTPLVGVDMTFEPPLSNELVLDVDKESVDDSFARLKSLLQKGFHHEK
ncbi:adenylyl-sulfate kinase [Thalassomonas viridans]|nr:adenylyl-sulfate kinase [Thalassomonas viridans]